MSRGEPAPPKHLVEKDKVSQLLSLVDPLSYHWWSEGGPGLNLFLSCGRAPTILWGPGHFLQLELPIDHDVPC